MIIRTAAQTVEATRDTNSPDSDWRLNFKDRIGNEFRVFVSEDLVEDLIMQIEEQRHSALS